MSESRRSAPRGRVVEFIRLIFVALLGTAGFEISIHVGAIATSKTLLGVFLGAATGYVIGGVIGRLTATAATGVERELRRKPAAEIASAVAGLILGLLVASLMSIPLFRMPPTAGWPLVGFVYVVFPALGYRIGSAKWEEIFAMVGLKPRVVSSGGGQVQVIDTSVLIDGRVVDLAATGFLGGTFLIHAGVLAELQRIADSSDPGRRIRGRRGLDVLGQLQRDQAIEVSLVEEEGVTDVDAALVRLARERGGALVTADVNLAKVAEAVRVPVRSVNALATAFRVPYSPGDPLTVHLVKAGREHGQAVGYLEDGTMVVVEGSSERLGEDVRVRVSNMLQTPTGRMVFATLDEGAKAREP